VPRIPLGRAVAIAEATLHQLRTVSGVSWAETAGPLRRGQELVDDIQLFAAAPNPTTVLERLEASAVLGPLRQRTPQQITFAIDGVTVDIHVHATESAGAHLILLTGSAAHVERLRHLAGERTFTFESKGLRSSDGTRAIARTEEEIYATLGLPFIPPEIRNDGDEIDAALTGRLPSLVSRADIRGDLHMHSHWSDGRDSIEEMVAQCDTLGYEYLAITDHSPRSSASRNLSLDGVQQQADEIASLRERYPQIAILHGVEVDILPNGRLDFPDRVLGRLDIVVASLHDRAGQSREELLRRYESAMTHPLVAIVTHPMNRSGPGSRGYDLDVDRLFELAVETGTILEIDGAPSHIDLEASLARRAAQAGVMLSIDSDAHRTEMLERHMTLGLLTARRGWVSPTNVINVRSHAELTDFLARKRRS
jgi:DNA polymerase (family 10)